MWPPWCDVLPPFGVCEYSKLFFQWQSSPDLLASPYLKNDKTYILKHAPTHKAAISYLQMVMARVHRAPVKDGKKSKKMKRVIICEACQALLRGWKFIIRLI